MLHFLTLASGSSGNASLVVSGSAVLLLDAGISARRITTALKQLGIDPRTLTGVLVTHEHSDHVSGLATLTKQLGVPVYATGPTLACLRSRIPALDTLGRSIDPGDGFPVRDLWVQSFSTSHDAACSVGYTVSGEDGKIGLATDLGYVSPAVETAVRGCDVLVCEANHDADWVRSGPYPYYLKQRILGDRGHLSNEAGAELAAFAAERGTRTVILGHLSAQNNTPVRAREVSAQRLSACGIDPERDLSLSVAPRAAEGPLFRLARGRDVCPLAAGKEAALC